MSIARIETVLLSHPKTQPPMQRTYALVRVTTADGVVGYGEASSNYGHSYPTVVRAIVEDVIAPNLVGRDPLDIAERTAQMCVLLDGYLGWDGISAQVIGAIEIALWDIKGKISGCSVVELLGGRNVPMRVYATGTTMFDAPPEWYAHYFDAALAHGVAGVKVRLSADADASVARVRAVRKHVGPDIFVAMDAYWGYSAEGALELAHRLADQDIAFFEEPCPQHDLAGLKRLAEQSPIPIAIGERVYTPSHYRLMADLGCASIFEPDACISGGLSACMEIASLAKERGIRVIPHLGSPTAVGLAANLHWAAAAGCDLVEYDVYPDLPARDDLLPDPVFEMSRMTGGMIAPPSGPGLGIEIDESAFARLPYRRGGTFAEVFTTHESGGRRMKS